VLTAAQALGFQVVDTCDSAIAGQDGNLELLAWLRWDADSQAVPRDSS
jgi:predicted rRNA methylase YqxC with S4 and FtsJ domains